MPGRYLFVIGTRPEAVKLAPVIAAARRRGVRCLICTTGQHPDLLPPIMAALSLAADFEAGQETGGFPVAALQPVMREAQPDFAVVQGDTRSAIAGAVAASLEAVPLAHVEAGLRSGSFADPFPEELFRRGIAALAKVHFAPTEAAGRNLIGEGCAPADVHVVGNTVVDALRSMLPEPGEALPLPLELDSDRKLVLLTVHRTENGGARLQAILRAAGRIAARPDVQLLHVRHPRLCQDDLCALSGRVTSIAPLEYPDFLHVLTRASLVITDSGGVHEEAVGIGRPLLIVRDRTERPEGLSSLGARLVGSDEELIVRSAFAFLDRPPLLRPSSIFGDGHAAERICDVLAEHGARIRLSRSLKSYVEEEGAQQRSA